MRAALVALLALTALVSLVWAQRQAPATAGYGRSEISGYEVGAPRYELASGSASVESVSFTIKPPQANAAQVRLSARGGWHECTSEAGTVHCKTPGLDLADIDRFEVVVR
jgi:hypothetical protein